MPHAIFDFLGEAVEHSLRQDGLVQLTPALDRLRTEEGLRGLLLQGERFDLGSPASYLEALAGYSK